MKIGHLFKSAVVSMLLFGLTSNVISAASKSIYLENEKLKATFNEKGLVSIYDKEPDKTITFEGGDFAVTLNGQEIQSKNQEMRLAEKENSLVTYSFDTGQFMIKAVYELKPGWRFVTRQIHILSPNAEDFIINKIEAFTGKVLNPIASEYKLSGGKHGLSLRLFDKKHQKAKYGIFMLLQNPFNRCNRDDQTISLHYEADMEWKSEYGAFVSDRLCIGTYKISGNKFRSGIVPEWSYVEDPDKHLQTGEMVDWAEIEAVTECMRAFLLEKRSKSVRVHIGWCENDYQIDVNTPEGITEYKRIIERASEIGCGYLLHTPHHSGLAPLSENRDAWGWESLLWLNLGQKIRKGQWDPAKDTVPQPVQQTLDFAKSKNIKLMAYIYPTVPFMQNPEWIEWLTKQNKKPGGYAGPDTGVRSFQDWLVDKLVDFSKATGCAGYSFDHWWIAYDDASSKYQQWYGCRRILENLRKRIPDIIIDGRQQYHWFGPWTWLGGTYPHPMMSDEQPGSFRAFTDLSTDRVNGNRQRFIAWMLRTSQYCPIEILPGFITHQTQRSDADRKMRRDRYRVRDWDYLGWRYSLLSSIATAPFNHVVNYIPARSEQEYEHFSEEDKAFFRHWLDFTDEHIEYMRNVRPIIGQPMVGRVDGTSAIIEDKGFVFLFNPNYRKLKAEFALDKTIGLTKGDKFIIKELYPQEDRLIGGTNKALWNYGDKVVIPMGGARAMALQIEPVNESITEPILFNCSGKATLKNSSLDLTDVEGEIGTETELLVLLPKDNKIENVTVNGKKVSSEQKGKIVTCKVKFAGTYFSHANQIGSYEPDFNKTTYKAVFNIPKRIFNQMQRHKKDWPIEYTEDDLLATWLDPSRLLLFVCVAQPDDKQDVKITIDGKQIEAKKAYNGIYPYVGKHTYMGIYADVSNLKPDVKHEIEVTLPQLKPGQFQGLFFENIETEYTTKIVTNE